VLLCYVNLYKKKRILPGENHSHQFKSIEDPVGAVGAVDSWITAISSHISAAYRL
jgi:hypothetical protein